MANEKEKLVLLLRAQHEVYDESKPGMGTTENSV